jgi:chromosome segregation ATPase
VKEGKELTEDQQHKIEEVNQKIDEQRQKLRELPRCTNVILTSMLHEAIDDMSEEKRRELDNLVKMRNDCLNDQHTTNAKLNDVKAQLRNLRNDAPEEERNKLQGEVKELEKKLQNLAAQFEQYRQQRMGILQEYYDQLKPEVVAKSLKEAPASFWECFNRKQTMLEVRRRFGANALVRGMNLKEGATGMDRNRQIGGHKA